MISIQIIDDVECFKWCLVRYLNPADHNPARITKADKDFAKKLFLKDMTSPVKVRYIQKIEKKKKKKKILIIILSALVFLIMKVRINIQSVYQKDVVKKNMLIYY